MTQFITPVTIFQGSESGDSPGVDTAIVTPDPVPLSPFSHQTIGVFADSTRGFTLSDESAERMNLDNTTLSNNATQQQAALYEALGRVNSRGAGSLRVSSAGSGDVVIPGVTMTGPTAGGTVVVRPDDIGLAPGQIPPVKTLLSIDQLANYPSVFVRKSSRVRGVWSQQDGLDLDAVNDPSGALGAIVLRMDSPPAFSQWVVCIDGTCMTIVVKHPTGSDFRSPREIWENVLMPAVTHGNNNQTPLPVYVVTVTAVPDPIILPRGFMTRMSYLSYARFEAAFEPDGTPTPITPVFP